MKTARCARIDTVPRAKSTRTGFVADRGAATEGCLIWTSNRIEIEGSICDFSGDTFDCFGDVTKLKSAAKLPDTEVCGLSAGALTVTWLGGVKGTIRRAIESRDTVVPY